MGLDRLRDVLTAIAVGRTPARIRDLIGNEDAAPLRDLYGALSIVEREAIDREASDLDSRGIQVMSYTDADYPGGLLQRGRPVAPVLFYLGRRELFHERGVGMCGSRNVTALGLKAATACGDEVSFHRMTVVSGYAAGVDTATHLAALKRGGATVIVLAEGINHFRVKRDFQDAFDYDKVLVVSQFPPDQPWAAHAAMSRNKVIFGLGSALVVVEAGPRGGTLAAGEGALAIGKPVFVLNFGGDTPEGNALLLANGGEPIGSREELGVKLRELLTPTVVAKQASLDLW